MPNEINFFIVFFICAIIGLMGMIFYQKIALKKKLAQQWGKTPKVTNFDKEESLKEAWETYQKVRPSQEVIDDITWHDLDLMHLFELINATKSSLGAEALYQRLRRLDLTGHEVAELQELVDYFNEHDSSRSQLQYFISLIGKKDKNLIWYYLVNPRDKSLGHTWVYYVLGSLPVLSLIALSLTSSLIFVYSLIASMLVNILVYQIMKPQLERELTCMNYLVSVVSLAPQLAKVAQPKQKELHKLGQKLKLIRRLGFAFRTKSGSEAELFFEYLTAIFLLPFISYKLVLNKLEKLQETAMDLVELIGNLDLAMAVLNFKKIMPYTTVPEFKDDVGVEATEMYHPLLSKPVTNEVNWSRNTIVTGSNASGKSTYLKGVALNCILAQTIGLVCSETWQMKHGSVLSSMALEDDLFQGDSYFVAEIKSVKRIIDQAQEKGTMYCFIDEILRGTNTVERISASASIISWLNHYPSLAFVASHDIELTEILKNETENIHFSETVTPDQGIEFDYRLREGPARSRNAIKLLSVMAYPTEIIDLASQKAQHFDAEKSWQ